MDKIEVTQADREAAWPYRPSCYKVDDYTNWMAGKYDLAATVIKGFATHRLATRTDATPVAWLHTLHMEQGQVSTRLTDWDCADPDEPSWGAFGRPGRDYSEEYTVTTQPLYTHPPATDVAALVEAAKASAEGWANAVEFNLLPVQHWQTANDLQRQLRQALAPFMKGQP